MKIATICIICVGVPKNILAELKQLTVRCFIPASARCINLTSLIIRLIVVFSIAQTGTSIISSLPSAV
jgi:hypothetical protein